MTKHCGSEKKLLAVASAGGHWKELVLLAPAFTDCNVYYVTTMNGLADKERCSKSFVIKDSNKDQKFSVIFSFFQLFRVFFLVRPDFVISTGASPGALSMILGRLFLCKTIWVDSIANSEELSLGGKISKKVASQTLTQWSHLADEKTTFYRGSVF